MNTKPYDAIIIGAGLCGIIFLKYAREKGLQCLVLDKQSDAGGLWNWLPSWQDIQNRKNDFAINNVPLNGVKQPDVHEHIHTWIRKYDLASYIRLQCEVTSVTWEKGQWQVQTNKGVLNAYYVIAATGAQNIPRIPEVSRSDSNITEMHSSAVQQPEDLANKRVTIVGGGASAWDLLDLSIEQGAKSIHWVYRNTRWFLPSTQSKHANKLNDLRMLSRAQAIKSPEEVSEFVQKILKKKYEYYQIKDIQPSEPFDIRKDQIIPGRPLMLKHFDKLVRHQSEVSKMRGCEIMLTNGTHFETDIILWATGYHLDLSYLGLPELDKMSTLNELTPRLGSLVRSVDYPNLFFAGMSLLESTSATPFFAAVEARSIVAHILGKCEIPVKHVPGHISHWDLFRFFAGFDHYNYPGYWWKIKYNLLAWWYAAFPGKQIRI